MQQDPDVIKRWTGSAPVWEKHRETIRHMLEPVSRALAEAVGISAGMSVLDVATGPGEPALSFAAIVGPQGRVCGVDPIPGMVEAAQGAAVVQGFSNVHFETGFADSLPYPEATFDAVVCRFGVMFFPSPVDGVREMLRVLKPGGKLALAVWRPLERNYFHWALTRVVNGHVDSPPPDPDAPDVFRFAPEGKLRAVLLEAGAGDPVERVLEFRIETHLTPGEFIELRLEMSEKLREVFASFSPEEEVTVRQEMLLSLNEFYDGSGLRFPSEVMIVTAAR